MWVCTNVKIDDENLSMVHLKPKMCNGIRTQTFDSVRVIDVMLR